MFSLKKLTGLAAAATLVLGLASGVAPASAAVIAFTNWQSSNSPANLVPTFTVESLIGGDFEVTIDISPASPNGGLLTGVLFDLPAGVTAADITPTAPTSPSWTVQKFGTNVAFQPFTSFDYGFEFTYSGPPKDQVPTPVIFKVENSTLAFLLTDWTRVGLRFQTVGDNGELSEKTVSATVIPLPAPVLLLLAGLGGLGLVSRRRKAQVA